MADVARRVLSRDSTRVRDWRPGLVGLASVVRSTAAERAEKGKHVRAPKHRSFAPENTTGT